MNEIPPAQTQPSGPVVIHRLNLSSRLYIGDSSHLRKKQNVWNTQRADSLRELLALFFLCSSLKTFTFFDVFAKPFSRKVYEDGNFQKLVDKGFWGCRMVVWIFW